MRANVEPWPLVSNLLLFLATSFLQAPGKFSLGSPLLTAYVPTFLGASLILLQLFANIYLNKWWAEGNAYLMLMQIYSLTSFGAMVAAMWNVDAYLYDARLVRYV